MICFLKGLKRKLLTHEHWMFYVISLIGFIFLYEPALMKFQDLIYGTGMPNGWNYNTTLEFRKYIDSGATEIIINPENLCKNEVYLLIIVCSAVQNFEARQIIRKTWGNPDFLDSFYLPPVKIVFLMGKSNNHILNSGVKIEASQYNDIIQENFHDTYNNLTLKSISLLQWATTYCRNSTYLMKTDDDMWVNVVNLMGALMKIPDDSMTLIGNLFPESPPTLNSRSKWYMPRFLFPERRYPDYLAGSGYVMSLNAADELYKVAESKPMIHIEDIFITGLCARAAGVRPVNHEGFFQPIKDMDDECSMWTAITIHLKDAEKIQIIWEKLLVLYDKMVTVGELCENSGTPRLFFQLLLNY